MTDETLIEMNGIERRFPAKTGTVHALCGVSIALERGRTLGIVGESGSGKSTLGRILVGLERADAGEIRIDGQAQPTLARTVRPGLQMVFQDPYSSLNPRMRIGRQIAEALIVAGALGKAAIDERVGDLLERVGLSRSQADLYPHEFSGGQRQRIAIARALAPSPRVVVADEPVSALDVSVQAQILNLFADIQRDERLAYLLIAHDIAVVAHISDRIAVMYRGRVVEEGLSHEIVADPRHPYTQRLLEAVPRFGRRRGTRSASPEALPEWQADGGLVQVSPTHFHMGA